MTGYIMAAKSKEYDFDASRYVDKLIFSFSHYDSSKYNKDEVVVRQHSFDAEVPDNFDPRDGLVANLEREKKELMAKFQARVTEIAAQIQSLLAIENHAEVAS
ncbi:TPA: hypothetical protein QDC06_004573 [Burkholderia cepacia]|nr:hypothetical protein [Burkholderia cepacia]